ncbi:MAG TPA: DUF1579 domain-containing protein [Candidatus Polarisedimenticolia bacterium]|nr:DUF1579 domain-containing protein [Candidatus Polarisedimenticolia bacterium]
MHKLVRSAVSAAAIVLAAAPLAAQSGSQQQPQMTPEQQAEMEAYMKAGTPGPQHQALAATAGDYDLKIKSWHEPGGPAMEDTGTAKRTMILDGRVLVEEVSSSMMGMPFTGRGMTGYDNVTGKYWSTWTDSMSTGIMVSQGTCDAAGKNCTFTGSWNDPVKKGPVTARMTTRWTSPTTEVFEMHAPDKAGKEFKMMEITYSKK